MSNHSELLAFQRELLRHRVASKYLEAMEFDTPEALKEYLKDHPNADKSKHTVKKHDKDEGAKGESGGKGGDKTPELTEKISTPKPAPVQKVDHPEIKAPPKAKEASRVGVGGKEVPPPPKELPRLPNLTDDEKHIQDRMLELFESDPDAAADQFLEEIASKDKWCFETDAAKMLLPGWSRPDLPPDEKGKPPHPERAAFRARYNAVLHQAANAIVKKAFVKRLDDIAKMPEGERNILVTSGGVAAGKGSALGAKPELKSGVAATWDAAGEQNATENEWLIEECAKRGIRPTFLYVHADPKKTWRGVVDRAKGVGRMVDAQLFADSYATGAKNFKEFYDKYKDQANFSFGVLEKDDDGKPMMEEELDDSGKPVMKDGKPVLKKGPDGKPIPKKPRMMDDFPEEALKSDTDDIYQYACKDIDDRLAKKEISEDIYAGATMGRRAFKE